MLDRRDSPDVEPIEEAEPRTHPGRRFARLVVSPASRKVALPRLVVAVVLVASVLGLVAVGVVWLVRSTAGWVDRRPEHQLRFDRIEFDPQAPPWIKGGAAIILDQARSRGGFGETVALLDLDLAEVEQAFRHCDWVKDVLRVDRSHYGHLVVRLEYRKPAAIVEFGATKSPHVLDEQAVVLSHTEIEWDSRRDPYQPRGFASPLIKIKRIPPALVTPRVGLPVKRKADGDGPEVPDETIFKAAWLARFLLDREASAGPGRSAIQFDSIYLPSEPGHAWFLLDSGENQVAWGHAPGDEKPGEPSPEARWTMLVDWLAKNGPLDARGRDFLGFTTSGAFLHREKAPGPK